MGGGNVGTTGHFNWEFETITNHMLDILLIVDQNQIVQYATPSFEDILGYSYEDIIGRNAFEILYPEDRNRLIASHREVLRTQKPAHDEYRVFHSNGDVKYLESQVTVIPNNPENLVVVTIRDITVRKKIENELQKRKNRYQELQYSLKVFSKDLSTVTRLSELENRVVKELNVVISESNPEILVYDSESRKELYSELQANLLQLKVGKLHFDNGKILILIGNRREQIYILTLKASAINESMDTIWLKTLVYYTIMVFERINVIDNLLMQLETAIQRKEKPQWISRLLFNLSERQRLELSSELHDSVLNDQIELYNLLKELLLEEDFDREVYDQLNGILQGLLDTIHQVKMTCNELRPPMLREIGLERTLKNLFEETHLSSTFKIMFKSELNDLILDEEKTIAIYRIVQELLNNAGKHSYATKLFFNITLIDDKLNLEYYDDGRGFDVEKLTPSFTNMGLSGMRERILSLNGNIDIISRLGRGLQVRMQIPISV
ncbi:PAS domain-containing sensor histidine kinase [Robertmurraya kyonggiensis]|uniref:PAS domain S-box protein n=1 Tax=Robertmurraya kyonggiensis TaxID=1037680 RepID=A0A4U1DFC7_9BACI|nr:PAS domain S-box protein [Robertmurraya kyonggiensis]TKC20107.1 PAS domain S-box protein [Robertmurraya kyonggiensis]